MKKFTVWCILGHASDLWPNFPPEQQVVDTVSTFGYKWYKNMWGRFLMLNDHGPLRVKYLCKSSHHGKILISTKFSNNLKLMMSQSYLLERLHPSPVIFFYAAIHQEAETNWMKVRYGIEIAAFLVDWVLLQVIWFSLSPDPREEWECRFLGSGHYLRQGWWKGGVYIEFECNQLKWGGQNLSWLMQNEKYSSILSFWWDTVSTWL